MEIAVYTHEEFERQFKRFAKKYHSLINDYKEFILSIKNNPFQGSLLYPGVRKVRMKVSDKNRGKGGGMRIITYTVNNIDDEHIEITLLYIYDKSEMPNVSDNYLKYLLNQM